MHRGPRTFRFPRQLTEMGRAETTLRARFRAVNPVHIWYPRDVCTRPATNQCNVTCRGSGDVQVCVVARVTLVRMVTPRRSGGSSRARRNLRGAGFAGSRVGRPLSMEGGVAISLLLVLAVVAVVLDNRCIAPLHRPLAGGARRRSSR